MERESVGPSTTSLDLQLMQALTTFATSIGEESPIGERLLLVALDYFDHLS